MAYIAPIHRASAARHAVRANFFEPDEHALVIAKANRAEIYTLSDSGLSLRTSFTVYGTISGLLTLRPSNSVTDHLFIVTAQHDYFTVSWDPENETVRNEITAQDVADRFLRETPCGPKYISDPEGRMMGIHSYEGMFLALPFVLQEKKGRKKSAPSDIGNLDEPTAIKLKELMIVDMAFLHGTDSPVLAILYRDGNPETSQLITYEVARSGGVCELKEWEIRADDLEAEASLVIPLAQPFGGVIVLGEQMVVYYPRYASHSRGNSQPLKSALEVSTIFKTWNMIDKQRYLLGDEYGNLKMLFIKLDDLGRITDIVIDNIGKTSPAKCLVYLDNGHVFVGSQQGDSQLIKLGATDPKIQVISKLTSLSPVFDFQIVGSNNSGADQHNMYGSGQTRIVAGCGGFKDGCLRSVRSGVGLKDSAILGDMEGVRGLWAVKSVTPSEFEDILVVSFNDDTRIFRFDEEGEVEEMDKFMDLILDQETLLVMNTANGGLLQVTPTAIRVMHGRVYTTIDAGASKITVASSNGRQLVCSQDDNTLLTYTIDTLEVKKLASRVFEHEVACIYTSAKFPDVVSVGFWTSAAVQILSINTLETKTKESLANNTKTTVAVPRSVALVQLGQHSPPTLLVAMGDGTLHTFSVDADTYAITNKKVILLDTQAVYFRVIPSENGSENVFSASDHPSLIYDDEGRLVCSAVTAENISHITPFNTAAFPNSVMLLANNELKISTIDPSRNIQIKTLAIGDAVRRIAYSKELQLHCIATIHSSVNAAGEETYTSFVRLVDDTEFLVIDTFELQESELVESILCCPLSDGFGSLTEKFLVGTGYQPENEEDMDTKGRLLVFEVTESRKLQLSTEMTMPSAVKALGFLAPEFIEPEAGTEGEGQSHDASEGTKDTGKATTEGLIITALSRSLEVLSYTSLRSSTGLTKLCSHRTHSSPIDLSISGNIISIADLMKGPHILQFHRLPSPHLKELAHTYQTSWTTSLTAIDKHTVIAADADTNITMWQRDEEVLGDRKRLRCIAEFRLGEMVNRFRNIPGNPGGVPVLGMPGSYRGEPGKDVPMDSSASAAVGVASGSGSAAISAETETRPLTPIAFLATVEGGIYMIATIRGDLVDLLLNLQTEMMKVVKSLGELEWGKWRAYSGLDRCAEEPLRVVEGEFVGRFLELEEGMQRSLVDKIGGTLENVKEAVESLRWH
ncbi:mono-functional DNA-alkylating methyl methanesulfonate N-term-domain-containing protein [Pyronema omphalodes]|nr:mono-functional DNA-alkylating methyl methanesulfonate N-term-domain-containing protein [Pyronema omphalodes]